LNFDTKFHTFNYNFNFNCLSPPHCAHTTCKKKELLQNCLHCPTRLQPQSKNKRPFTHTSYNMDATKTNTTAIAVSAGVVAFVVVVGLLVWLLVSMNRTEAKVTGKNQVQLLAEAAKAKAATGVKPAPTPAPARVPQPQPHKSAPTQPNATAQAHNVAAIGGGGRSMRAAVLGSSVGGPGVGGHPGAPYRSATASHTFGIPFPSGASSAPPGAKPAYRDSIWADPLPQDADDAYKGARARQSAAGMGGNWQLTATPELFNRTPDELDAKDIDIKDAFPGQSDEAPKNGHEAVAAMYSWDNFRAAVDRDSGAGYLAPVYDRQGWSKMGARDPRIWSEQIEALRDEFPKNMDLKELMDSQMVPVPDQFYDLMSSAAAARGEPADYEDSHGIGARASGRLYEKLQQEWEEQKSGRVGANGPRKGTGAAEAAMIVKDAVQSIPMPPSSAAPSSAQASVATKIMAEIVAAHELAQRDGLALPELSAAQLRAAAAWASRPGPGRKAALELASRTRTPLPPAPFAAA
jgi:hypothetical protein